MEGGNIEIDLGIMRAELGWLCVISLHLISVWITDNKSSFGIKQCH
jgi:hypothetical protein